MSANSFGRGVCVSALFVACPAPSFFILLPQPFYLCLWKVCRAFLECTNPLPNPRSIISSLCHVYHVPCTRNVMPRERCHPSAPWKRHSLAAFPGCLPLLPTPHLVKIFVVDAPFGTVCLPGPAGQKVLSALLNASLTWSATLDQRWSGLTFAIPTVPSLLYNSLDTDPTVLPHPCVYSIA